MDEHVIEALGKTKIILREGKVAEIGEPKIEYCPLFDKYRGIKEITLEAVKKKILNFELRTLECVLLKERSK